jgi:hypothetical protein
MRPAAMLLLASAAAVVPVRAPAQTAYSIDFGAITAFNDAAIQVGFRAAPSIANKAGPDIGVGVLGRASPTLGVRIDYTHHRLVGGDGTLPFSSITFGIVWMH